MENILIVCKSDETFERLSSCVCDNIIGKAVHAGSGSAARRLLVGGSCPLLVIYTPLPDEFGGELSVFAAEKTYSGIILLCSPDIYPDLREHMTTFGVTVLPHNADSITLKNAAKEAIDAAKAMTGFTAESKVQLRSEEIRSVNTAKQCLIRYMGLTEPQAHRYIEKQAMDKRVPRKEIVRDILLKYDMAHKTT